MPQEATIPGGYILLARKMLDSELMNKPPHYLKLWLWLLCKAFWKDGEIVKRGQLQTSISEMQDIGRYKIGNQFVGRLTVDQVRAAYNWFKTTGMISIAKPTEKMTITVINFDSYQDSKLYESQKKADTEALTGANPTNKTTQPPDNVIKNNQNSISKPHGKPQSKPHTIEKKVLKEVKTSCASPTSKRPSSGDHQLFIQWWCFAYEHTQMKPYIITARDGKSVKALVNHPKLEFSHLIAMAAWLLTTDEAFYASDRTLPALERSINKTVNHIFDNYRKAGIIPPEGTKFRDWHFWPQNEEQEALAL